MARILLVWELGSGNGHWANLQPIAERLANTGHEVVAALRNVTIGGWHSEQQFSILQAPYFSTPHHYRIQRPTTFVQMLHNIGFHHEEMLSRLVAAWQNLYALVDPDIVLFEHSPTALLAARDMSFKKVVLGTGFYSPPNVFPIPDPRYWVVPDKEILASEEKKLIDRVNHTLNFKGSLALNNLGQLFEEVNENFLLIFEEFDHYGVRPNHNYWGTYSGTIGIPPIWLEASSKKKVFAYLKMNSALPMLLSAVLEANCEVLAFIPNLNGELESAFQSKPITFIKQPVNIAKLAFDCDLAILNGNIASATSFLLKGIPSLNFPLQLEQLISARRLADIGASAWCRFDQPAAIAGGVSRMLEESAFEEKALEFADRYSDFDSGEVIAKIVMKIEELL